MDDQSKDFDALNDAMERLRDRQVPTGPSSELVQKTTKRLDAEFESVPASRCSEHRGIAP